MLDIQYNKQMIEQIWNKKIVMIIEMSEQDIADEYGALPLVINVSWNSYIGFYYEIIRNYFQMCAPFPLCKQDFHLTVEPMGMVLQPCQIVYQILEKYKISLQKPVYIKCHFRSQNPQPEIDLQKYYKNNLKSSTALKYGKFGAQRLQVQMTKNNVQNLYESFKKSNYKNFLGSTNFESDNLGYIFLNNQSQKIAIRFINQNICIQRTCNKDIIFQQFVKCIFGQSICQNLQFKIHLVKINNLSLPMALLQKYSHPDGYLYIHI